MSTINLLGPRPDVLPKQSIQIISLILVWLVSLILLGVVILYWFYAIKEYKLSQEIDTKKADLANLQTQLLTDTNRQEILLRQGQVEEIDKLIQKYPQWSKLLPELAKINLKTNGYLGLSAKDSKRLRLTLLLPNFAELDKFVQIFSAKENESENLYNLKIVEVKKFQTDETSGIRAVAELSVKETLFIDSSTENKEAKP